MEEHRTWPWRNTATEGFSTSPAQCLFSRRTSIWIMMLPAKRDILRPEVPGKAVEELRRAKEAQKSRYNRNAHDLPPLRQSEKVWVQTIPGRSQWTKGRELLAGKQTRAREYLVEVNGQYIRRNRRHIKKNFSQEGEDDVEFDDYETKEDEGEHTEPSLKENIEPQPNIPITKGIPHHGQRTRSGRTVYNQFVLES